MGTLIDLCIMTNLVSVAFAYMEILMIKLVVFDLDGTLANTIADLANAMNYGLQQAGLPVHTVDKYNNFVGSGLNFLVKRAVPTGTPESIYSEIKDGFNKYYAEHSTEHTTAYAGTEELLDNLSMNGIITAVLSNKPDKFIDGILKKIFPDHRFTIAWGKKPEYDIKPDPASLCEIIKKAGVNKEQCLYVGDSDIDCFTAKNAEVKCCGAAWGFRGRKELEDAGADYVIDSPEQLMEIIKNEEKLSEGT